MTHGRKQRQHQRHKAIRRQIEARFRDLVEGSLQGVHIHRDHKILFANQVCADIFGYTSPAELRALDSIIELIAPHERDRLKHYAQARLRGEDAPSRYECQGIRKDGEVIWLENHVREVNWEGAPAIQVTLVDISERKKAEAARRQSEEAAQRLAEENAALAEIGRIISSSLEINDVYERFVAAVQRFVPFDRASIWLFDSTRGVATNAYTTGIGRPDRQPGVVVPFARSAVATALLRTRTCQVIGDLTTLAPGAPFADQRDAMVTGLRSLLAVPLRSRNEVIGMLSLQARQPYVYTPAHQTFVERVGDQIAGAVANTQLYEQQRQVEAMLSARVKQMETIQMVVAEIGREFDLTTLLHRIIEHAVELVGSGGGVVFLWDQANQVLVPRAWHKMGEWIETVRLQLGEGVSGRVAQCRQGLVIDDYKNSPYAHTPLAEHLPAMSVLAEPLLYRDRLVGVITINKAGDAQRFTAEGRALFTLFAAEAALAIENARLFEEGVRRQERLTSILDINRRIATSTDLEHLVAQITQQACRLVRASGARVGLRRGDHLVFESRHHHGVVPAGTIQIPLGVNLLGQVVRQDQAMVVTDLKSEARILPVYRQRFADAGLHSAAFVPIRGSRETLGVLYVTSRQRRQFTADEVEVLTTYAEQVAIAIEHARLMTAVEERTAALEHANANLRREITEHQRTALALQESEARYRELFENANDIVYTHDQQGQFTSINRAAERITGYTRDEALRLSIADVVAPEYLEWVQQMVASKLATTSTSTYELDIFTKHNERVTLEVSTRLIYEGDTPVGVQGIGRNITERKRLEAQLLQAQKMEAVGTLAGGIAHDFNNILAAVLGYTELALYDTPRPSAAWLHLQEVLTAANRAKELVRQILAFSRQIEHKRKPLQLRLLIQEALTMLRASLPSTIELKLHLAEAAGPVLADPIQMHQVLLNLCSNAEHAMRQTGGILEIDLEAVPADAPFAAQHPEFPMGPYVRLTVCDTGHGIAPEIQKRIFEPFFTTKPPGEGTGMGLALVHGIVTSHGGVLKVQSVMGQGTRCEITLPQVMDQPDEVVTEDDGLPTRSGYILFVDDESSLARVGQEILGRLGYDVMVRTSSVEALEAFRAMPQRFDLVITDQTMPTMTGEMLARELRRIRPDIPIILCTGFSHLMHAEKAQAMGIDAFLMKPIITQELAQAIQQVLAQRQAQRF